MDEELTVRGQPCWHVRKMHAHGSNVVREFKPTTATIQWLLFLALGMYNWKPTRWTPLHVQRSKYQLTDGDMMALISKGFGIVVLAQLVVLLVCVKTIPHVALAAMSVRAVVITFISNATAVVTVCGGMLLLALNLHYALPLCFALSLTYWWAAIRIGCALSPFTGVMLVLCAVAKRQSFLLFPLWTENCSKCGADDTLQVTSEENLCGGTAGSWLLRMECTAPTCHHRHWSCSEYVTHSTQ
jgi:hypothetical protein